MRTYYLFKINESFSILYLNKTFYLYKMLEQISLSSKTDFIISYRLFEQMAVPFNKTKINATLYKYYEYDESYSKTLNKHILDNNIEKTKLTVYNTYIKIKTNKNLTDFFNRINEVENIFVCDFVNKDYFWLDKVISSKKLV